MSTNHHSKNGDLATSEDKSIKIWNVYSGSLKLELTDHSDSILEILELSNGWLASASRDKTVKIWSLTRRNLVKTFEGHTDSVISLKQLENGYLASCSHDNTIKI